MRALYISVAVLLVAGCGKRVGDECKTNVECQADGTRFCDTSPADGKGYCTVDGCDVNTCPDEAACIRFLTPVLDEPCLIAKSSDPSKPRQPLGRGDCPHADDRCVCDAAVDGVCPEPVAPETTNGHCAPESTERRWCQLKCEDNGDCRENYECRSTGTFGAEPVPTLDNLSGNPAKFCAPQRPPTSAP